MDSSK
jgi:hypothetical protein